MRLCRPATWMAVALLASSVAAGCARPATASGFTAGRLNVVTAFYPLRFLAAQIGGDAVSVTDLTKPGAEPHDVELNPRQVASIVDAGLVVYLKGFQSAVDQAVAQEAGDRGLDVASTVRLLPLSTGTEGSTESDSSTEIAHGRDPHVWLDPNRYATIADALAARLAAADPAHTSTYAARAAALHTMLDALDDQFAARLRTCARREIVTGHSAFNYLATRYGLTQVSITGISPEAEPAPRRLAAVAAEAQRTHTTTIFFETLVSPKVAETLAREVGATTAVLDPLEGLTEPGGDYFSGMRGNLAALTTALGCTT
ncbi:MAG: zinc transport system substrate-binding protein [Actinoplanes sp.]|jgi:zinc transport system substrate-binding protein|nr:zinc transport system substrate-binding protein [Actinoplanes sp.]